MALILDAGALIAVDRRDRQIGAALRVAQQNGVPVRTTTTVVAQASRNGARQANLARVLTGLDELSLDRPAARRVGELLQAGSTADVADGHIAVITQSGDTVYTSDPGDLRHLLDRGASRRPSSPSELSAAEHHIWC